MRSGLLPRSVACGAWCGRGPLALLAMPYCSRCFWAGFSTPPKIWILRAGRPAGHVYDRELLWLVELVAGPQGWSA